MSTTAKKMPIHRTIPMVFSQYCVNMSLQMKALDQNWSVLSLKTVDIHLLLYQELCIESKRKVLTIYIPIWVVLVAGTAIDCVLMYMGFNLFKVIKKRIKGMLRSRPLAGPSPASS